MNTTKTEPLEKTPTVIDGASLVADPKSRKGLGVAKKYAYWMGVIPGCPNPQIDFGGLSFPMNNEMLIDNPAEKGSMQRIPALGGLNAGVTEDHIAFLRDNLHRVVIRFTEPPLETKPSDQDQLGLEDSYKKTRKGFVITIPTQEEVDQHKGSRHAKPPFDPQKWDEPAANYMYFLLCEDQRKPKRGSTCPETLNKTGITWPEEIKPAPKRRKSAS